MRRGIMKFRVIAAHKVTTKNPSLRRTYLNPAPLCLASRSLLLWEQMEEHHSYIRIVIRRWLRVRVSRRRPTPDVGRVVLVPVDFLCGRDERHVTQHHLFELIGERVLSG